MFQSLCEDDSVYPFPLLAPISFFSYRLCCPHIVLFLSGANAPERFITSENVREGRRVYEAEENEHWRTKSKRASTASNTPHAVSVYSILCVCVCVLATFLGFAYRS